ncbi:myo-inositol-1(or 4)-monophosphatase [Alkalihalobacillus xiaoxiensis]|uniref:Myo-inositol-1(Or 4)-monophosphatase n=1 Tax=Shouchella xiaoxiensis TaxID=766895 RepID=A0ABS2SUD9_9BACI|nr:inositol monophosphatase family protein [Shouchella xiaoxiensis]MBM7839099.1 myo-inositol-1(or 4)-monophosphatase [Shouchella xiaoxiensis]
MFPRQQFVSKLITEVNSTISKTNKAKFTTIQSKVYTFIQRSVTDTYPSDILCFPHQEVTSNAIHPPWLISLNPYHYDSKASYVLSILIVKDRLPVHGWVFDNLSSNLLHAEKGGGAYVNGKRIFRDELMSLREAEMRIHSSFLRKSQPQNPAYQRVRQTELPTSLEICGVAEGNTDIFLSINQTPYEFAAASLIAKEAGVEVMTLEGEELSWSKSSSIWCGMV